MANSRHVTVTILLSFLTTTGIIVAQPSVWTSRGPGGGGAFYQASISPHNAAEMFITSDMSNVFRSTDGAATWNLLDYRSMQGSGIAGRVAFTSQPLVIYALSAVGEQNRPAKSTDGGATWTYCASDPTSGGGFSLYADPNSTANLFVTDYSNLYYSSDGGATFALKFTSNANGAGCHIAGAFFDGATIYVGTNAGLLVSTNGGSTFAITPLGGMQAGEVMLSFAGARQGSTVRLLCVVMNSADVYAGITGADFWGYKNIYSIDVGQSNWTARGSGIPSGSYPFFIGMARNTIDVAYVAGGSGSAAPVVLKTTNGGGSWQSVFQTANNQNIATGWSGTGGDRGWSYGEYALGFTVAPMDPSVAIITDLGCAHVTASGGASWRQAYVSVQDQNPANAATPIGRFYHGIGLENTSCWSLCWIDNTTLFLGQTDIKGARSNDAGQSWSFGYTGHSQNSMYRVIKHPVSGTLYAATSTVHDMYESTYLTDARINPSGAAGRVLASTDKGVTWTNVYAVGYPVVWVEADKANANRLYASVIHPAQGGIYVTNNALAGAASTWTKLATPPRTEGHPYNIIVLNDGSLVCSYSGRRAGSPQAFTASSGVFYSTDQGASWLDRSSASMRYWTKDVVVDPTDASQNTWYCGVANGWGGPPNGLGGLYKTTDRGVSWNRVLTLDHVESCAFRPDSPAEMYITTETSGLWYTANHNAPSPNFVNVASYKFRHPMRVFFNPTNNDEVWVTSFGGGLFTGTAMKVPVELASFHAAYADGAVRLTWSTTKETNNRGFTIERSMRTSAGAGIDDAQAVWRRIGFVHAGAHSVAGGEYVYTDGSVFEDGVYRYRLQQEDNDGTLHASPIASVEVRSSSSPIVSLFPNPVVRGGTVRILAGWSARIEIADPLGRVVKSIAPTAASGSATPTIDVSTDDLLPGFYLCRISTETATTAQRLVVLR
jgi:photosystem II stability/assembly factor-like uncharacterized protein